MPEIDHATLRAMIAAVPDDRLRSLFADIVLGTAAPEPSVTPRRTRRGGWPKGKPRKVAATNGAAAVKAKLEQRRIRNNEARQAKRAAARAAKAAAAKTATPRPPTQKPRRGRPPIDAAKSTANGAAHGAAAPPVSAQSFWEHCKQLEPTKPWCAASRELGVNLALAQDSYRVMKLPPNLKPVAVARFLTVAAS